jgi:rubredoxin
MMGMSAQRGGAVVTGLLLLLGAVAALAVVLVIADDAPVVPALALVLVVAAAEFALSRRREPARVGASSYVGLGLEVSSPAPRSGDIPTVAPSANVRSSTAKEFAASAGAVPVPLRQFISIDRAPDDPQCPNCGYFLVDARFDTLSRYRCRVCGSTWRIRAGDPWPDVRIVPNLRRLDGASSPSAPPRGAT